MALSLQQLRTPPTRSEITSWLIETLRSLGFTTTAWQPGRIQHSILNAVATVAEPVAQTASSLVSVAYNEFSNGAGLDLYSESRFNNSRDKALKARGHFKFSNVGIIPHDLTVGNIVITDPVGNQFIVDEELTLGAGGTETDVLVTATLAGAAGQIPNNSTLTLTTPLAGVTVTNPGTTVDGEPVSWADVQTGTDPQTDLQLKAENSTKWGLLSVEKTDSAYVNLAIKQPDVTKALVINNNPRGPGTVDLLVSSNFSLLSDAQKQVVQEAFAEYTFLTDSAYPPASDSTVYVKDPIEQVLDLVGAVYYQPSLEYDEVLASVTAALDAMLTRVPIGGEFYSASIENVLTVADITDAIMSARGVISVTLTSPAGDLAVGPTSLLARNPDGWVHPDRLTLVPGSR